MEAILFVLDIVMMTVLVFGVVRAEAQKGSADEDANLGFFAFKRDVIGKH